MDRGRCERAWDDQSSFDGVCRSKAGTFDKKTRKTMEEIKDLEYRLEASKKRV